MTKLGDRLAYQEFGSTPTPEPETASEIDLPPEKQTLKIEVSRKGRKGKTVTLIQGFQQTQEPLQTLLKQLKTHCGSGGTLKEQTLEIQGDHGQKLMEFLAQKGYKVKRLGG